MFDLCARLLVSFVDLHAVFSEDGDEAEAEAPDDFNENADADEDVKRGEDLQPRVGELKAGVGEAGGRKGGDRE